MRLLLFAALVVQTMAASFAVTFNIFLLFIIRQFTPKSFGLYKYILMSFSLFEIMYAIVVILGSPIFFVSQRTLIAFTYYGPIAQTPIAILGPTTYCFFYEIWLGFVDLHFIYRYMPVCQRELKDSISRSRSVKMFIWFSMAVYIIYCFFCAYVFCTSNLPHKELVLKLSEYFGVDNDTVPANYVLRFSDVEGNFSLRSTIAVLSHYIIISGSILVVIFCTWSLWFAIRGVRRVGLNISLEKQLFKSLILQTTVPIIFSHFPSLIAMFFPLIDFDLDIFSFFSVFTTVPKALDPIILMLCIKCYRRGVARVFSAGAKVFASTKSLTSRDGQAPQEKK